MFDSVKTFARFEPVTESLKLDVDSICKKIYHNAAIREMELLCKEMTKHNDYDINHYKITSMDSSEPSVGRFSFDVVVEYIEHKNDEEYK